MHEIDDEPRACVAQHEMRAYEAILEVRRKRRQSAQDPGRRRDETFGAEVRRTHPHGDARSLLALQLRTQAREIVRRKGAGEPAAHQGPDRPREKVSFPRAALGDAEAPGQLHPPRVHGRGVRVRPKRRQRRLEAGAQIGVGLQPPAQFVEHRGVRPLGRDHRGVWTRGPALRHGRPWREREQGQPRQAGEAGERGHDDAVSISAGRILAAAAGRCAAAGVDVIRHVLYLHGFASSPASTKAARLAERLARHGLTLHRPDFNQPEFETLTVSRMIDHTQRALAALPPGPVALIGSSLGGLVALVVAASRDARTPVERLVLLAPALDFGASFLRELGRDGLQRWRETDRLDVFHHGDGAVRPIRYAFFEDAVRYDPFALEVHRPTLIVQGRRDEAVDPAAVARFAETRPHVTLRMVDDDHQLLASLPEILDEVERFLGLV